MHAPMELTTGQKFEIERLSRAIDATADPEELRQMAKQLLRAWHTQKAATDWFIRQQVEAPFVRTAPHGGSEGPNPLQHG